MTADSTSSWRKAPRDGTERLRETIKGLSARLRAIERGAPLRQSGIYVTTDAVMFAGNVAIEGTLSLPAGVIDNAALATPIVPDAFDDSATNFSLTLTSTAKASQTLTTPDGFTKAVVSVSAYGRAENTTGGGGGVLFVTAAIDGVASEPNADWGLSAGQQGRAQASFSRLVTDLTDGATFDVEARLASSAAWSAVADNTAVVTGTVLWFR